MSSMDQKFVKAFARRGRPSRPTALQSEVNSATSPGEPRDRAVSNPSVHQSNPNQRLSENRVQEDPIRIGPSVAQTAEIWIDPNENRLVRFDATNPDAVPAPHRAPETEQPNSADSGTTTRDTARSDTQASNAATTDKTNVVDDHALSAAQRPTGAGKSVQACLDLLQQSFTTLESPPYQDDSLAAAYPFEPVSGPSATTSTRTDSITRDAPDSDASVGAGRSSQPEDSADELPIVEHRVDRAVRYETGEPAKSANDDAVNIESDSSSAGLQETISPKQFSDTQVLRAAWEVDVFDVPQAVADLFFDGPLFQQVAERIQQAVNSGLGSMMVTSMNRGEGRSTVAIGMAMAAAASGLRVALVDADAQEPTLIDDLRLELQYGWVDTIRGGLPIREVAIHAVEDGVTLIPLMPPLGGTAATDFEVVQLLQSLSNRFDLIVVDAASGESSGSYPCAQVVDSALIVRDPSRTDTDRINELSYRLREAGVQGVGIVENFA